MSFAPLIGCCRGYLTLFIPQLRPRGQASPLNKPPGASETPLFDRSAKNSFGNFVWVQGPRRSAPSPRTEAICSGWAVRGARAWDIGSSLAVDGLRLVLDTPRKFESCCPTKRWPLPKTTVAAALPSNVVIMRPRVRSTGAGSSRRALILGRW